MSRFPAAAALSLVFLAIPLFADAAEYAACVVRVIDGDTIVVDMFAGDAGDAGDAGVAGGASAGRPGVRVRLIGIDCPESRANRKLKRDALLDARHTANELIEHGRQARLLAEALIPPGKKVRLVTDTREFDRYGRMLAYVYAECGMVNGLLALAGAAAVMTVPPNVAHEQELRECAARAERARAGIWR